MILNYITLVTTRSEKSHSISKWKGSPPPPPPRRHHHHRHHRYHRHHHYRHQKDFRIWASSAASLKLVSRHRRHHRQAYIVPGTRNLNPQDLP